MGLVEPRSLSWISPAADVSTALVRQRNAVLEQPVIVALSLRFLEFESLAFGRHGEPRGSLFDAHGNRSLPPSDGLRVKS